MRQHIFLAQVLWVVFAHDRGVGFVHGVDSVQYIIVEHEVFEVDKCSDLFVLVDLVDDLLVLGQHIILDDLFPEQVHSFVVVNAVCGAVDLGGLVEPESPLKSEFDPIEQHVASLIEHCFSFLLL